MNTDLIVFAVLGFSSIALRLFSSLVLPALKKLVEQKSTRKVTIESVSGNKMAVEIKSHMSEKEIQALIEVLSRLDMQVQMGDDSAIENQSAS